MMCTVYTMSSHSPLYHLLQGTEGGCGFLPCLCRCTWIPGNLSPDTTQCSAPATHTLPVTSSPPSPKTPPPYQLLEGGEEEEEEEEVTLTNNQIISSLLSQRR